MGSRTQVDEDEFDYVVIGSGSAGSVIAARLSEDSDVSVLLIEAGGEDRHPVQTLPVGISTVAANRNYNWFLESEPEAGLHNRRLPTPRGRTLGGSSSINAMIAMRGNPRDFDRLRESGLEGWGYEDLLPYFKRLETHWRGETPLHGAAGPIGITPMMSPALLYEPLEQAARAAGLPIVDDPNGRTQDGLGRMEATIRGGRRSSTSRAYLRPARRRPNLKVLTDAMATRIIIERRRATGVAYRRNARDLIARARREVILCAGAFGSPQLLMLSGIGPAAHLASLGIESVLDLPAVGENLCEHPNLSNTYRTRDKIGLTRYLRLDRAVLQMLRWTFFKTGPFATNGATANIFLRTIEGLDRPDVQLTCMPVTAMAQLWLPGRSPPPLFCMEVRIGVLHPASRGNVRLRSANAADKPLITYNIFEAPEDLATMIRGLRATRALYATDPLAGLIEGEVVPGAHLQTDDELSTFIRANAMHRAHPVGTCRMGADADAVVDGELKLRGIDGLRVADASIMPESPSGNTNLPTIMIGEKASDLIRGRRAA